MKRTRLISVILVILMLLNALMPVANVVFADTPTDGSSIGLGDGSGTGTNTTTFPTYNKYEFNNKLYKALKADFTNRNIDAKYDDINRTISINSEKEGEITELNLNYGGINDLTGLNVFKNVTELYLSHNDLSENSHLEVINSFNLTKLDISSNKIADVSAIAAKINSLVETDGIVMGNQVCEIVQQVEKNDGANSDSAMTTKFELPQILTMASNVKPHWERIEFVGEDMHGGYSNEDHTEYADMLEQDRDSYYVLEGDAINDETDISHITINDMPIYVTTTNNKITLNIGAYYRDPTTGNYSYVLKRGMLHFRIKVVDDQTEAAQANNTNKASTNLLHDSVFDLYFIVHDQRTDAIILKDSNLYKAIKEQLKRNQLVNDKLSSYKYTVDENGDVVYDCYTIEKLDGTSYYKLYLDGAGDPVFLYNPALNRLYGYTNTATTDDQIESLTLLNKQVIPDTKQYVDEHGNITSKMVYKIPHESPYGGRWLYRAAYDDAKAFIINDSDLLNEITNLKLNNKQIRDLTGIEGFFGLALELNLSHNYLESITPLVEIMKTKAAKEASLQSNYNEILGKITKAYNDVKAAQQQIDSINNEIKADQESFKNTISSAYKVARSKNDDETKRREEDQKSRDKIRDSISKAAIAINDKFIDIYKDENDPEKITSYGYISRLYGHKDRKNVKVGAYEELEKAISRLYSNLDMLYNGVYKNAYKTTTLLADSLNYQDILEYEKYLEKTEGFDDVEATYESSLGLLNEEISYICSLESRNALSDFDKKLIKAVFPEINFTGDSTTPIAEYFHSEDYEAPNNRFNVINLINKFRVIATYSEMANYCLIKRMVSEDVATDNCFAIEYLKVVIHEKEENQIDCKLEQRILKMLETNDKSGAQDNSEEKAYDVYKEYINNVLNFSTYKVENNLSADVTGTISSASPLTGYNNQTGSNLLANVVYTSVPKGGSLQLEDIKVEAGAKGVYDITYNRGANWTLAGNTTLKAGTRIRNGLLEIDPTEEATQITITGTISDTTAHTYSIVVSVGDYVASAGQSAAFSCTGQYRELGGLSINFKGSSLKCADILESVNSSRNNDENTYFDRDEDLTTGATYDYVEGVFNEYIGFISSCLEYKDLVNLGETSTDITRGINETRDSASTIDINSHENLAVYNQLMTLMARLTGGNVSRYITIPKLVDLDISYNAELSDISAITQINTLNKLNAEYDYIANVDQVDWSQLPQIRDLNLGYNFITDITPLTKLKHLKALNLRRNLITEVPIMADDYKSLFRYLKLLDLSENSISDLYPLIVYLEHITNGDYANYLATNDDGVIIRLGGQKLQLNAGKVYLDENPETFDFELPRIFTQLMAIDVSRTAFGMRSSEGRIENEGTFVTLPTRTLGDKEGVVVVIPMSGDGTPVDTCVGVDTTATIKYKVLQSREAVIELHPSGNVEVPKGGTKKFSVTIENLDTSGATVQWMLVGNTSQNTKIVDGELTVGEDEAATSFQVNAEVVVGGIERLLTATVIVKEPGGDTPTEPTTPTVTMTPANTSTIKKGESKTFTISGAGFKNGTYTNPAITWTLSGNNSADTKTANSTTPAEFPAENPNGTWAGGSTTVNVAAGETAGTLTLTAVASWKKDGVEQTQTLTNTITVSETGTDPEPTPTPTDPDADITSVKVSPNGTIEMNKGEVKEFTVTVEGKESADKGVTVTLDGTTDSANTKLNRVADNKFSVTVSPNEGAKELKVKVTSQTDSTKYDEIIIKVKGNEGSNPDPTNPDPSNPDPTNPEHPTTDLVPGYPVKDGTNLTSVLPKTPVDDFKAKLVNNKTGYKVVVKKNGTEVTSGVVSTGCTVEVQDSQGRTLKDANGHLLVYDVVVKGDINGDGVADSLDSLLIKAHRAQTSLLNGSQALAADIDEDGDIDLDDARRLLYHRAEVKGYVFNYTK